jgi:hypothetical protein
MAKASVFRIRQMAAMVAALLACLVCCDVAWATGQGPELSLGVGLSATPTAGTGISALFRLTPFPPGSEGLPAIRSLRLSGDLGSLNAKGVPTCKPRARSLTAGCTAPAIGAGRVFAYSQPVLEGDVATKLHGTVEVFSGGRKGPAAHLYGWVRLLGAEQREKSFVISMTFRRLDPSRSELSVVVPKLEGGQLTIAELLLSLRKTVRVDGRSIRVTEVDCPQARPVEAEVSFYRYADTPQAETRPKCAG